MATRKQTGPRKKARTKKEPRQADLEQIAQDRFGFSSLRPGQREAVEALLGGKNCLVVMPTGAGKSAIYQIAGLLFDGITVIISPLIALQKDQVDSINAVDAPDAVVINSTQKVGEAREVRAAVKEGTSKYVFLAPEQLHREDTMQALTEAKVSLFVVDEAHCVSEWGHDFRPDYLALRSMVERLGRPQILAMTATASPAVRREILSRLGMQDAAVFVHGFDRPNIQLRVDHFKEESAKVDALVRRVGWSDKPGIVYVATRKHAEQLMHSLSEAGIRAAYYHAGLKPSEREEIQERFMNGDAEVIVATNAFGMGIDKADVRFVFHCDVSDSLDSYYQEIGRAGRDGEKAEAVLFYRHEDLGVRKFLAGEGELGSQEFERVTEAIAEQDSPVRPDEIASDLALSKRKLASVIHRLEDAGAIESLPTGEVQVSRDVDTVEAARGAAQEQMRRKEMKNDRLRVMQDYAEINGCRREYLLRYFGDDFTGPCGNCDNCLGSVVEPGGDISVDPSVGTRREVA